ncbi:MAG: hypothetical protein F4Y99_03550 [Acidimicrobiaceae bacterium]|nr:hypothetical protein [Acidimicrobiaceae bacterium]MDE0517915.1 hypothetical protein [Acidimicrobiaceae bacterium]MDE0654937.1 hypothetical protein [Acidimicrobiaceae bacterium]MXZ94981.1 hypothetical protein [Acidimicrobiaceae bacterium]MYF42367.1 hypothetical protein [Acidimicrobiaceae bacterium]
MRFSRGLAAASLLAVALCLLAASPLSAADGPDGAVVGAEGSDVVRVVSSAQSEVEADPDSGSDRRLVDRESSERIDAVVIALWTIAGVMTVLLGLFLWHTSPRRRLRLAGAGPAGEDSSRGRFEAMAREALLWLRSKLASRKGSGSAGDSSQQESDGESSESESVDESAVWKFSEENGEQRSV